MSDLMRITTVQNRTKGQFDITFLNHETATAIHRYHESFPVYRETPLVDLSGLAESLGVAAIYVKDESYRFGLNAFKVLGGSYAIGKVVANHLGLSLDELPFEYLISDEIRECLGEMTFITATDGNHGRGVAWTARQLHQKSIVYMPADTAAERAENIRKLGASVTIQDANYDECVRMADWLAKEKGYYIVQDTAWPGYEEIPRWIMQGYITMAYEAVRALEQLNQPITHVFPL